MFGSGIWEKNLKIGVSSGCISTSWSFFGFLELEVVFWDNINYIFNCINSDFKLNKNLKLQCGLTDINSPLHLFLPFLFLKNTSQNKLSYEIMCCSTQSILRLLIIWRNPFKKKCRILKSLFFRSVKPKSKGSEKAKKQEKGDKRYFFKCYTPPKKTLNFLIFTDLKTVSCFISFQIYSVIHFFRTCFQFFYSSEASRSTNLLNLTSFSPVLFYNCSNVW